MGMTKKYWKGLEELEETPSFLASKDQEFQNQQAIEEFLGDDSLNESSTTRRDFLKSERALLLNFSGVAPFTIHLYLAD